MKVDHISAEDIHRLVDGFYAKVRADRELGPIFARAIPGDWEPHLATMRDFWSSVMLTSGRYKGNPPAGHRNLKGVEPHMFERWLALFDETCGELFTDDVACVLHAKAVRIAESLKLAMFFRPGRPCPAGGP